MLTNPTMMVDDNNAANTLSREDVVTHGNQYVDLSCHFNKGVQEQASSTVHYIETDDNISDLVSKCVDVAVRKRLRGALSGYDLRPIRRIEIHVLEILKAW
jgi:hypothetical protein